MKQSKKKKPLSQAQKKAIAARKVAAKARRQALGRSVAFEIELEKGFSAAMGKRD